MSFYQSSLPIPLSGVITFPEQLPCIIACVPSDTVAIEHITEKENVGVQPDLGYAINIGCMVLDNPFFRRVLYTVEPDGMQLVIMRIPAQESIGPELHPNVDQMVYVESGSGIAKIGNDLFQLVKGALIIIPRGVVHDIANSGIIPLQLYVIYSRPVHAPGKVNETNPKVISPTVLTPVYTSK